MTLSAEWKQKPRIGRAPATTHGELSALALELFLERGFDATTVDDIAHAAGIGRRTLFRYFPSKNDLPWGDFEGLLDSMRSHLAALPDDVPLWEALRVAVLDFNRFPADQLALHRERMRLLLGVPSLVAHSALRYAAWRQVIAGFAAARLGTDSRALEPQAVAHATLGLCLAAYEQWLADEHSDLLDLLDRAFRQLGATFAGSAG